MKSGLSFHELEAFCQQSPTKLPQVSLTWHFYVQSPGKHGPSVERLDHLKKCTRHSSLSLAFKQSSACQKGETLQYMGAGPFHATCSPNIPQTSPEWKLPTAFKKPGKKKGAPKSALYLIKNKQTKNKQKTNFWVSFAQLSKKARLPETALTDQYAWNLYKKSMHVCTQKHKCSIRESERDITSAGFSSQGR